jgi:type VI secretion system secreted protein VgrG
MQDHYLESRAISLSGPGDMKGMAVMRLLAEERISQPFRFELDLAGAKGDANPDGILGQRLTVTLKSGASQQRYFNGVVTRFSQVGYSEREHLYRAEVRPAFWLLTRRADCRVLQNLSTPQIFADVCRQAGFSDHKLELSGSYSPWEYRVQYRETDFDFLSRLLEHEGIYYYFQHEKDRHTMVLVDDVGKLQAAPGYDEVPYYPPTGSVQLRERDHLTGWSISKSFQAAAYAARDFDFKAPGSVVAGVSPVRDRQDTARYEIFDYPAGALAPNNSNVDTLVKRRAEQLESSQTLVRAEGDAVGLMAGHAFRLTKHPRADQNKRHVILASTCEVQSSILQGKPDGSPDGYKISQLALKLEVIDARVPYRPPLATRKPLIHGTQTAVVVGTQGEEIWTDKYGRVKVQFHWDRAGKADENSSCWVRVAQGWAGKNWGMQHVPRIGQEVVVSFLEGDPDRPIVLGSVYNNEQMPPYALPDNQTQSGVKSRSSKQGTAEQFNELRFEDKKGEEEIYIHAEKNLQLIVENDQIVKIGASKKDKGDRSVTIHNDDKLTVGNDLTVEVKGKETRTVDKDRTTTVKQNDTADVKQKFSLTAGQEISLEVGQASIVMKSDGTIEISGMTIKLKGSAKVEIDGAQTAVSGQQVEVKGAKTAVEGSGMLDLASGGIASLKGTLTKIG